jgi:hypothetical protein
MAELYRHSGAITVGGTLLGLLFGAASAVALGFVYTYAIVWIPFVYVNFFLTLFFGVGVGFATSQGCKLGKLRNMAVAGLLGAFCGLLGLWTAWAVDPLARGGGELTFDLGELFAYMGAVYETGSWGFKSVTVTGIFLGAIWAVEAVLIVVASAILPPARLGDLAFCESCDVWTRLEKGLRTISLQGTDPLIERIRQGDVAALREAPRADAADAGHVRVDLASCPGCVNSAYLTLTKVQKKLDDKGKESVEEDIFLRNLPLTAADVAIVKDPPKTA